MTAKKKRRQIKKEFRIDKLKHQIRQSGLFKEGEITFQPSQGPKLSAVLEDFIKPYQEIASTDDAYRKLIALAVVAWNAAILSKAERKELIDTTINSIVTTAGEEWRKDSEEVLRMLIKHKERHFPDDRRFIVDYRLTKTMGEFYLSVASVEKN